MKETAEKKHLKLLQSAFCGNQKYCSSTVRGMYLKDEKAKEAETDPS